MARDGSGVFSKLYSFVAGTVIEAAKMNSMFDDFVTDANAARPVTAGGTGGTSVIAGWDGLAKKGTDIASASSINLNTATGPSVTITGTVAITSVTLADGAFRIVRAAAALPITASANLLVNGSSSVSMTCTAEDLLLFRGGSGGVVSVSRITLKYTEGTWTPGITFGGAAVGLTYSSQSGYYIKIGSLVFISCFITLSAKGSSTGTAALTGLPFTAAGAGWTAAVHHAAGTMTGLTAGVVLVGTNFRPYGTTGTGSVINDTNFTATSTIAFSGVFTV